MADKKRKGAAAVSAPPPKKSRKSSASEPMSTTKSTVNELAAAPVKANDTAKKSKTSRKRAADFLGDEEKAETTTAAPVEATKSEKKKKSSAVSQEAAASRKKSKKASLTADGVNGVVTDSNNAEVEVASAQEPSTSLEAEGLRTADKELEEENASDDEDQGAALLTGFDSDGDDPAEDMGDMTKTQPLPQFKKTSKKLRQAKEKGSDGPGTVYVGRIPHGFYESQMRDYFSQFGDIRQLRLSRNKRTGASKHFAFIEFESDEVAKIVAETMDNYLLFGHILKCKYAPSENLHPDVWKGANKKYRKIPHDKLQRLQLEAPKTQEQWAKKNDKETRRRQKQAENLKALGYEYVVPKLRDPSEVVKERKAEEEHGIPAVADEQKPDPIEAPPAPSVPADELVLKKEKEKKSKKPEADGALQSLTRGNLRARNAGPAAESAKITQNAQDTKNKVGSESVTQPTKLKKMKSGGSTATSNHGDYDKLSSIPVGIEAAPSYVTDAIPAPSYESIATHEGVADAILAGRKSDRQKAKSEKSKSSKSGKTHGEKADDGVKKQKDKKSKGTLKKDK